MLSKHKKLLKQIWDLVKSIGILVAIFSTIFTVWEFNYQQRKIRESDIESIEALKETLKNEIDKNLEFMNSFETQKEKFKTTDEWTLERYSTIIIESAINQKIGDEDTKKIMMNVYFHMVTTNRAIDNIGGVYIPLTHEQYLTQRLAKNETTVIVSNNNKLIQNELLLLRTKILNITP